MSEEAIDEHLDKMIEGLEKKDCVPRVRFKGCRKLF